MMTILHEQAQNAIIEACKSIGVPAQLEYRGSGYRADAMAFVNGKKYAFEIQVTRQTLKKTQERQEKYLADGVMGCWLFEKEPARQNVELEHLPIFQLIEKQGGLFVSLKGRKVLPIDVFVKDFVNERIKFCHTLKPLPIINIQFVGMRCWKCGAMNHIYFLAPFHSACNTEIFEGEGMWTDEKFSFHPEIIKRIQDYSRTEAGKKLSLATIKKRYSRTVDMSYMSFGCNKCDSIFGDWYVHEAEIDAWYGDGVVDTCSFGVDFDLDMRQDIPHWCHPGDHDFCE